MMENAMLHGKAARHMTDLMRIMAVCCKTAFAKIVGLRTQKCTMVPMMSRVNTASCKHPCVAEVKQLYTSSWWMK